MYMAKAIVVSVFITTINFVFAQTSYTDCVLNLPMSSTENNSTCGDGNWGGFLKNNCCCEAFNEYLYALGQRAKRGGQIYLNSTEQKNCLVSMRSIEENVLGCGIQKLTSGAPGCSDYSVKDVNTKLGNHLRNLVEDCKHLGSDGQFDQACSTCLRRWEEMGGSSGDNKDSKKNEADVCKFAVLVSMASNRIDDKKWNEETQRCLGEQSLPIDERSGRVEKKLSTGTWILIGGVVGILGIILVASWIMYTNRNEDQLQKQNTASDDSPSKESSLFKIPIKEIYSATNNLNESNFIGQGIAGKVYKGILSNGQHVAIKHITNDENMETFVREVTSLSHVRHPNLVALLGNCEKQDECFLVYELCCNGNLSHWLFGKDKVLLWIQRLEIAIDCARGLWFLHTYPEGCIVHRDIKPTNILIGANFEAKLSDFGLSKVMALDQSYVSSEVRGTFGYVDPEYQRNHHVNSSGDVYSFGIVLLQILSGQRVINLNLKSPMPLDKMAKYLTRGGNITEFADPKLNGEYSVEAFDLILKLALSCTGLKRQRPSMEQVVLRLEKALDISTQVRFVTHRSTPNMAHN